MTQIWLGVLSSSSTSFDLTLASTDFLWLDRYIALCFGVNVQFDLILLIYHPSVDSILFFHFLGSWIVFAFFFVSVCLFINDTAPTCDVVIVVSCSYKNLEFSDSLRLIY